ncbi:MAG: DUF3805 domain-containing protein [Bacteroidetes bacterium]|nr:DUF3805 domain-containing protein [Bacteroidota bacterium]
MKHTLLILLFLLPLAGFAQTNLPGWDEFRSDRFGFTMKYPDQWNVNEISNGIYNFKNPYVRLGTFQLAVTDQGDSMRAKVALQHIADDNEGGSINTLADKEALVYKSMSVQSGVTIEVHHWVFTHENYLFHFTYSFDSSLMHAPNLMEERKQAYQVIETLNFMKQ